MKAKEYAEKFTNSESVRSGVFDLLSGLISEGTSIMEKRNAKKDSSVIAVIKEQNMKWKAVCRIVNKDVSFLNKDGFEMYVKKEMGITL